MVKVGERYHLDGKLVEVSDVGVDAYACTVLTQDSGYDPDWCLVCRPDELEPVARPCGGVDVYGVK